MHLIDFSDTKLRWEINSQGGNNNYEKCLSNNKQVANKFHIEIDFYLIKLIALLSMKGIDPFDPLKSFHCLTNGP